MRIQAVLVAVSLCVGCGAEGMEGEETGELHSALSNKDFDVDFSGCAEFAGIGFVPAAQARALVPTSYAIAGDAQNAIAVIRIASCQNAVVDGKSVGATITSQVGITLAGGDPTSDINNYTVAYVTNQANLHARFQSAGLDSNKSNTLSFGLLGTALSASSSSAQTSSFTVQGSSAAPTSAPTTFVASWWGNGRHGTVQSRTVFPAIRFGGASTALSTPAGSSLSLVIGGTTLTFALLDSYNTFTSSHLEVRVTP